MTKVFRRSAAVTLLGLAACAQVLGLDDLRDRQALTSDAGQDSSSAIDASTTETSTADTSAPECTFHRECLAKTPAQPSLCAAGKCVAVKKDLCSTTTLPLPAAGGRSNLESYDDVFLVAAFVPIAGVVPESTPLADTYALALEEIERAGLPDGRHMAMLLCGSEPNIVEKSFRHVVDDLKLPAMIGRFDASNLTKFVEEAASKGIFTLNPGVTTEALKFSRDLNDLAWNLLGTPEDVALAYRPLLQRMEKNIHAHDPGRTEPIRVALLTTNTSTEEAVRTILVEGPLTRSTDASAPTRDLDKALFFNDAGIAANGDAGFLDLTIDALENKAVTGKDPDYIAIHRALRAFKPDVVIALTREEVLEIAQAAESDAPRTIAYDKDAGLPITPRWLLSTRNATDILPYVATGPNARRVRYLGVQYAGPADQTQRRAWLGRMLRTYQGNPPESEYQAFENYYDAVYWLGYGLAAAGPKAPLTGTSIKNGVRNLLSGTIILAGADDAVGTAFGILAVGKGTFHGALGAPDIDMRTGTWNSVGGVYCYADNPNAPPAYVINYDVLRYNRNGGTLDVPGGGLFNCFVE